MQKFLRKEVVIPFKCSLCGVDFGYDEGGRCTKCNNFFCNNHLYEVKIDKEVALLCEICKGDIKGKKKSNDLLKIKESLSKLNHKHD